MSLLGKIFVKLGLDNSEFKRGMNESKKDSEGFGQQLQKLKGQLLAVFSVTAVWNFAQKSIQAYNEQAVAIAKLESVLKSTGNAAGITSKELQSYASELQRTTMFGDEATLEAMTRLATFKSVQGQIFKDTIAAAQDLATVLGGDLNGAVMQLGKALEQPEIGLTMLRRSGISFSTQQIEEIQKLVAEGKKHEAQMKILAEVQTQFGGAAKAAAGTAQGSWVKVKNALGDLMEVLGSGVEGSKNLAIVLEQSINRLINLFSWKPQRGSIGYYLFSNGANRFAEDAINKDKEAAAESMKNIKTIEQAQAKLLELSKLGILELGSYGIEFKRLLQEYISGEQKKTAALAQSNEESQKEVEIKKTGLIPKLEEEISLKKSIIDNEKDPEKIRVINSEIALIEKRLSFLKMTKEAYEELMRYRSVPLKPLGTVTGTVTTGIAPIPPTNPYGDALDQGDEAIRRFKEQMEQLKLTSNDLAYVISDTISGAIDAMVKSINETGKIDSQKLTSAIVMPLLYMAKQMGEVLIAAGIGSISLKKLFKDPVSAIAAGTALVALSSLAISKFQAAANNVGAGGVNTTSFTGGAGGFAPSVSQTKVEVFGKISGNDILLSSSRANIDKRR